MPTRIFVDAEDFMRESGASTAQTADMNWIANEFVSSENETGNRREADFSLNDTTLSGSMLLEALQEFESKQNNRGADQSRQASQQLSSLSPSCTNDRETGREENTINTESFQLSQREVSPPSNPISRTQPRSRIRQPGPNEQAYMRTYNDFVQKAIGRYNGKGNLPNYRDMDEKSKDTERIFVLGLLKRLNIQKVPYSSGTDDLSTASMRQNTMDDSLQTMDETIDPTKSPETLRPRCRENDSIPESHPTNSEPQACLKTPHVQKQIASCQSENESPIEIARSKAPFESPVLLYHGQKRTATSSGKKGADIARTRHARPSEIFGELNLYDQPSEIAESSFHELSLSEANNLLGSESPMSHCSSVLLNVSSASSPGLLANVPDDNTLDDSLSEVSSQNSASLLENRVLKEVSVNPSLKTGNTAKYKPLQVNFEKKGKGRCLTQSVPNPFDGYRNITKQKLTRLMKWIRNRNGNSQGKGLILSLSDQQVIDVILNVINTSPTDDGSRRGKVGGTLIVLRTKEDVETWCRSLREGCALSVLNHPEMPRTERISPNVAVEKLASHSIVITTFDALKAGDATVVCDNKGVAVISQTSSQSDWQKARSSHDVRPCKEMSLIHHLKWQRVFFVDLLGKKGYLVKGGTARVTSARALSSDSRFVFVAGTNDGEPSLPLLMKSNKTATEALSSVLHLGDGDTRGTSITDLVADLNSDDTLK